MTDYKEEEKKKAEEEAQKKAEEEKKQKEEAEKKKQEMLDAPITDDQISDAEVASMLLIEPYVTYSDSLEWPSFVERLDGAWKVSKDNDYITVVSFFNAANGFGQSKEYPFIAQFKLNDDGSIGDAITLAVSYTHLRAHETVLDLVCRLLLEKNFFNDTATTEIYTRLVVGSVRCV